MLVYKMSIKILSIIWMINLSQLWEVSLQLRPITGQKWNILRLCSDKIPIKLANYKWEGKLCKIVADYGKLCG